MQLNAPRIITKNVVVLLCVRALGVLSIPSVAQASGFVKDSGKSYSKLSHSVIQRRSVKLATDRESYKETTQRLEIYLEYGVPLPWKAQVSLSTGIKSIKRLAIDGIGGSFESRGVTDSTANFKSSMYDGKIFETSFSPVSLNTAYDFGVTLPTTQQEFRAGSESQRYKNAMTGYESLVAPVDAGKWRTEHGLGLSLATSGLWVSQELKIGQDWTPNNPSRTLRTSVGIGLPFHSWMQVGIGNKKNTHVAKVETNSAEANETTWGTGLGFTVWNGLAIEANCDKTSPTGVGSGTTYTQWTFGLSYRDI